MRDMTITRASRQGAHTVPIDGRPASSLRKVNAFTYTPEEMAAVLDQQRAKRIQQSIRDYAHRKREP